jgi:hypothetical protein
MADRMLEPLVNGPTVAYVAGDGIGATVSEMSNDCG